MANPRAETAGDPVDGLALVIGVKDSAGNVKLLALNAAGQLPVSVDNGAIELNPDNLATTALQTSVGATAHTDAGAIATAVALTARETGGNLAGILTAVNNIDTQTQDVASETTLAEMDVAILNMDGNIATLLVATNRLAGFSDLTVIDYSGGDQANITDGSNGIWLNVAGTLKVDTWGGVTGKTFVVPTAGLFPLLRVKKIYMTGSDTAAGFIGYPPA